MSKDLTSPHSTEAADAQRIKRSVNPALIVMHELWQAENEIGDDVAKYNNYISSLKSNFPDSSDSDKAILHLVNLDASIASAPRTRSTVEEIEALGDPSSNNLQCVDVYHDHVKQRQHSSDVGEDNRHGAHDVLDFEADMHADQRMTRHNTAAGAIARSYDNALHPDESFGDVNDSVPDGGFDLRQLLESVAPKGKLPAQELAVDYGSPFTNQQTNGALTSKD